MRPPLSAIAPERRQACSSAHCQSGRTAPASRIGFFNGIEGGFRFVTLTQCLLHLPDKAGFDDSTNSNLSIYSTDDGILPRWLRSVGRMNTIRGQDIKVFGFNQNCVLSVGGLLWKAVVSANGDRGRFCSSDPSDCLKSEPPVWMASLTPRAKTKRGMQVTGRQLLLRILNEP